VAWSGQISLESFKRTAIQGAAIAGRKKQPAARLEVGNTGAPRVVEVPSNSSRDL